MSRQGRRVSWEYHEEVSFPIFKSSEHPLSRLLVLWYVLVLHVFGQRNETKNSRLSLVKKDESSENVDKKTMSGPTSANPTLSSEP